MRMEETEEMNGDIVQNTFTRYVWTALLRGRRDYLRKQYRTESAEYLLGEEWLNTQMAGQELSWDTMSLESLPELTQEPKQIRSWLQDQVGCRLARALKKLSDQEIIVLYAKVYWDMTFREIGQFLKMDWERAVAVYTYARTKIRKELERYE